MYINGGTDVCRIRPDDESKDVFKSIIFVFFARKSCKSEMHLVYLPSSINRNVSLIYQIFLQRIKWMP